MSHSDEVRKRFVRSVAFALLASITFAQEMPKPKIANLSMPPSDAVTDGNCTASWSGYWKPKARKSADNELGKFVVASLKDGYVITIYETKSGIFVDMKCAILRKASVPERP